MNLGVTILLTEDAYYWSSSFNFRVLSQDKQASLFLNKSDERASHKHQRNVINLCWDPWVTFDM